MTASATLTDVSLASKADDQNLWRIPILRTTLLSLRPVHNGVHIFYKLVTKTELLAFPPSGAHRVSSNQLVDYCFSISRNIVTEESLLILQKIVFLITKHCSKKAGVTPQLGPIDLVNDYWYVLRIEVRLCQSYSGIRSTLRHLGADHLRILLNLNTKEHDTANHSDVCKRSDRLSKADLLRFCSQID